MANETTSTSLANLSATLVQEARLTVQNRQDLTQLLTVREVPEGAISVRIPKYAAQTAAAQANEGQEISNSEITTTAVTLTPAMNATWSTVISDLAGHNSPQVWADAGRIAADAIIKKRNADIFALFDGFSTSIGGTGQDLTASMVRQGVKKLMQNNARGEVYLVITPEAWEDLLIDLANGSTGYNNMVSDNMRDAINGGALDVRIPVLGCSVAVVTSGIDESTDVKCGLFTREALAYAYSWDFKVESLYRPKLAGYEVAVTSAYQVAELDDNFGVELLVDGED